jgi:hypothetical protein
MEKEMINNIITSLNNSLEEKGTHIQFNDSSYKPIKLSKENFHEIKTIKSNQRIAFIDGGNTEILKAPNFSLQLIRIYLTIYQNNKRIDSKKIEFYILINAINQEESITYKTQFFGIDKEIVKFDSFDKTIRQGQHRISISSIGNVIRRFTELETAKNITAELENNDIIILDGDLKSSITNEIDYLNRLYEKAIKKNITIAAISKTSELFTEKGNALIPILNELSPKEEWYYHPLVKIENQNHKADIYILKLNKNSKHTFKFEISNKTKYKIDEILSILKENSKDPVFLGYPYGLIEADNFARVSNKEKDYLMTIFLTKLGKNNEKIAQYLNTSNSHNILDSISY